jgi:hypothetical protein
MFLVVQMPHSMLRWSISFLSVPDHESQVCPLHLPKQPALRKSISSRQEVGNLAFVALRVSHIQEHVTVIVHLDGQLPNVIEGSVDEGGFSERDCATKHWLCLSVT